MSTVNYSSNYTELNTILLLLNDCLNDKNDTRTNMSPENKGNKNWNMVSATQMVIFLLLVCGIFFAILMYCTTWIRVANMRYSEQNVYQSDHDENIDSRPLHSYSIYEPMDRPPSYSEVCNAPPLYECPFNIVSMLEPPPVYPETPKASDWVSHSITNHI